MSSLNLNLNIWSCEVNVKLNWSLRKLWKFLFHCFSDNIVCFNVIFLLLLTIYFSSDKFILIHQFNCFWKEFTFFLENFVTNTCWNIKKNEMLIYSIQIWLNKIHVMHTHTRRGRKQNEVSFWFKCFWFI